MEGSPIKEERGWQLLSLNARRRVFFRYEKRIRDLSPPDKVFDYFASVTNADGSRQACQNCTAACSASCTIACTHACLCRAHQTPACASPSRAPLHASADHSKEDTTCAQVHDAGGPAQIPGRMLPAGGHPHGALRWPAGRAAAARPSAAADAAGLHLHLRKRITRASAVAGPCMGHLTSLRGASSNSKCRSLTGG